MFAAIKTYKIFHNPYILFFPFLIFYCLFIAVNSKPILAGDEERYLFFAKNLIHGGYWYPGSPIGMANGPGYPVFLAPFVALNLPLLYLRLLNAILQYLSVVFLYKALKEIIPLKYTIIASLFWACYYNFLEYFALLYSETIGYFLVTVFAYCLIRSFKQKEPPKTKKFLYWSGFLFGYLALTKVIFGYVLILMLIGSAFIWLFIKNKINIRKSFVILVIAFATALPYLIFTYKATGKIFYWSTAGGDNLYWMSTPYPDEYGSWFWFADMEPNNHSQEEIISVNGIDSIRLHHQKVWEEMKKLDEVAQDDLLKKIAIKNIKAHPFKFVQNCFSNAGRLLFNYPYSYTFQKSSQLLRLPLNGFILVLLLFSVVPTVINWKKIIYSIRFIIVLIFLYLGGSILGSAETRMFTLIVPLLLLWIALILRKTLTVNLKFD